MILFFNRIFSKTLLFGIDKRPNYDKILCGICIDLFGAMYVRL